MHVTCPQVNDCLRDGLGKPLSIVWPKSTQYKKRLLDNSNFTAGDIYSKGRLKEDGLSMEEKL